ncbi:MAG: prepilin-type N-terminal cleavage/methylation domain-containing protein [Candidatus Levyibacteriota bacterium]|nr:MAG: prepilin-type N-terminal cleavage/methylation domain-containing protein [Candidatus Levybacteria bacterium]
MINDKGFTLIELIIVIAITAVLSVVGIAAFVNYSRAQTLSAATSEVATMLQLAKSRAQSQVKPTQCSDTQQLNAYRVEICDGSCRGATDPDLKDYEFRVSCGGSFYTLDTKKLPANISFDKTSIAVVEFNTISGGISGSGGEIKVTGYGNCKKISVNSASNISIGGGC